MRLVIMLSLLASSVALTAYAALPKIPPHAGNGIVIVRFAVPQNGGDAGRVVLYREPGIGRIAEKPVTALPLLTQVVRTGSGEYAAAVMGKRNMWLKIAYDEAGREGWVEMSRRWVYSTWEEFLPGRMVRLLPGINKTYGSLRREPSPEAEDIQPFPQGGLRAEAVEGDWLRISTGSPGSGWLRWRDDNGRFLVSLPDEGL